LTSAVVPVSPQFYQEELGQERLRIEQEMQVFGFLYLQHNHNSGAVYLLGAIACVERGVNNTTVRWGSVSHQALPMPRMYAVIIIIAMG